MDANNSALPKTVLIVEDEEALSSVLSETLTQAGYQVTIAANGEEGLKVALETHPVLILLDMLMPKKDGLSMFTDLRKSQQPPLSTVIFFTNINQLDKIASAVQEGAEGYIVKAETSLDDILKRVNDFFAKRDGKA